jgi:hypothetical protein
MTPAVLLLSVLPAGKTPGNKRPGNEAPLHPALYARMLFARFRIFAIHLLSRCRLSVEVKGLTKQRPPDLNAPFLWRQRLIAGKLEQGN